MKLSSGAWQSVGVAHVTRGCATLADMPTDEFEPGEIASKLNALLAHLGIQAREFAIAIGVDESTISKIRSGARGKRPDKLISGARRAYNIPDIYWQRGTTADLPSLLGPGKVRPMNASTYQQHQQHEEFRSRLAKMSADCDDPPEVIKAILQLQPPPDAELIWWVQQYRRLLLPKGTETGRPGRRA